MCHHSLEFRHRWKSFLRNCLLGYASSLLVHSASAQVIFQEPFANNSAGWTLGPEWQIGPAASSSGHNYGNPDPSTDNTATADNGVAGIVIGGNASTSPLHGFNYLTSPVINTSVSGTVKLQFYRWLNSDYTSFMQNNVEVFDGASWVSLFLTGGSPGVQDNSWTFQEFDVTAYKNANFQVRFGMSTGASGVFSVSSWNVDDVTVYVPGAPTVTTNAASAIGVSTATLNGTVNPNGTSTNGAFKYSTDSGLAGAVTTSSQALGSGTTGLALTQALTGLSPHTTYYFQATAANSGGTTNGTILNFTTGNTAPTLTAATGSITQNEGGTATQTGTWADADGDIPTLSVTAGGGTVVRNAGGTWSWSASAPDGPAGPYTVTIQANDGFSGGTSSVSFTVTVNNVAPVVTVDKSSVSVNEGSVITNAGSVSDPGGLSCLTARMVYANNGTCNSLAQADALLAGSNVLSQLTTQVQKVDFADSGSNGRFTGLSLFPGASAGNIDYFTLQVTGVVNIPTSGAWTFGVRSDDGSRLRVDGTPVITDNTLHGEAEFYGTVNLTAGQHTIDYVFFEHGGGAQVELFAAPGTFVAYDPSFRLVGDTANGGLSVGTNGPDTLTLTASLGTVTRTGCLWSWSYTPNDGPLTQTVTITGTDNNGGVGTQTFTLNVANLLPSATLGNSGVTNTGGTATVSFSSPADPGTLDVSAGFHYAFDFNNDGSFDVGDGSYAGSPSSSSTSLVVSGTCYPVRGRIIDKDGGFRDYLTAIPVNAYPTATFGNSGPIDESSAGTVSFTSPNDDATNFQIISAGSMTHAQAMADAISKGGWLATIRSAAENAVVAATPGATGSHWIGAADTAVKGQWRWVTGPDAGTQFWQGLAAGVPVNGEYSKWISGEPNNSGGNEDVVEWYPSGWNDLPVTVTRASYVLEKPDPSVLRYAYDFDNNGVWDSGDGTYAGSVASSSASLPAIPLADGPNTFTVKGRILDPFGAYTDYTTTVTVNNVAPTAALSNGGAVDEGSTGSVSFASQADVSTDDATAGFHYAYDFDNDGTWEVGGATYASATTSSSTTVPAAFLADGPANLTVKGRILDKNDGFTDYTTVITINNVAPTAVGGTFSLAENSPNGTVVGSVTGLDPGADILTYSITSGNTGGAFSINPSTGEITVANVGAVDYEANPVFTLAIQVMDSDGATGTTTVTVNILDLDEILIASGVTTPTGAPLGAAFHSLRPGPKINNTNDRCIFRAWLVIDNITVTTVTDTGIWYQDNTGVLQLLAQEGNAALGGADVYGTFNFNPAWTDGANYAFTSALVVNGSGLFTGSGGTVTPVLIGGSPAPGLPSATIGSLNSPVMMNEAGQMAVKMVLQTGVGGVTTSNDGTIVFGTAGGGMSIIAQEGSAAPGTTGKFSGLQSTDWISMDESGNVIYYAQLSGQTTPTPINTTNNTGLWLYSAAGGTTSVVARAGDAVPGLAPGLVYYQPRWGVISGGKVAFQSTIRGAGVTAGVNDKVVHSGMPGSVGVAARTGVSSGAGAPVGVPTGASFSNLGYPRLGKGAAHATAFRGEMKAGLGGVTLTNNEGIWKEQDGTVTLVVREGMASGIGATTLGSIGEPGVGENGRIHFTARLVGAGVTSSNDSVLFAEDGSGGFGMMLREGTVLPVGLTSKTVADLHNTYAFPEDARTMNVDGTMAFQAPFTDGNSGLLISNAP